MSGAAGDTPQVEVLERRAPGARDRAVILSYADGSTVRVRWRLGRPVPWRCDACGPVTRASCSHVVFAAVVLAGDLLGLEVEIDNDDEEK